MNLSLYLAFLLPFTALAVYQKNHENEICGYKPASHKVRLVHSVRDFRRFLWPGWFETGYTSTPALIPPPPPPPPPRNTPSYFMLICVCSRLDRNFITARPLASVLIRWVHVHAFTFHLFGGPGRLSGLSFRSQTVSTLHYIVVVFAIVHLSKECLQVFRQVRFYRVKSDNRVVYR